MLLCIFMLLIHHVLGKKATSTKCALGWLVDGPKTGSVHWFFPAGALNERPNPDPPCYLSANLYVRCHEQQRRGKKTQKRRRLPTGPVAGPCCVYQRARANNNTTTDRIKSESQQAASLADEAARQGTRRTWRPLWDPSHHSKGPKTLLS